MTTDDNILYEPDERCPPLVSLAVGFQGAVILLIATVLVVSLTLQGDSHGEDYLAWAVFIALIINGASTALQAGSVWRFGAGHVFFTNTLATYMPVSRIALANGGPALMATLVVVSSLVHFLLSAWLPLLRRIVTPVVSGTVLLLVPAMTIPIAFDWVADVPEDAPAGVGLLVAGAVLGVTVPLGLLTTGRWRMWSPILGIAAGCAVGAIFGMYDAQRVIDAAWVGVPTGGWPGLELTPGAEFWAILPLFLVVTLVSSFKVVGGGVAIQRASWRGERATDFRRVQGAVNAVGAGSLLTGVRRRAAPGHPGGQQRHLGNPDQGGLPRRGVCLGSHTHSVGVPAQGGRPPPVGPVPGHGRILDDGHGNAFRGRGPDRSAGRPRPPQGHRGGCVLRPGNRLPESGPVHRGRGRCVGYAAGQRAGRGDHRRNRADRDYEPDRSPPFPPGGGAGHFRLAED